MSENPNYRIRDLEKELKAMHGAYRRSCKTISDMLSAVTGEEPTGAVDPVALVYAAREAWREEIHHLATVVSTVSHERSEAARKLIENQAMYEGRIEELTRTLAKHCIPDPSVPESEAVTVVPSEFFDQLLAEDGAA